MATMNILNWIKSLLFALEWLIYKARLLIVNTMVICSCFVIVL